jgi:hypothetical protein
MRTLLLTLAILAAGCVTPPDTPVQHIGPIEGVWVGKLSSQSVDANAQAGEPSTEEIMIAVCGTSAVLWIGTNEGTFIRNSGVLSVGSRLNMHKIDLFHTDDGRPPRWAEQQTYTLIAYSTNRAKLQWSRAVTNPLAAADWPRRHFLVYGIADMDRTEAGCNPRLGK